MKKINFKFQFNVKIAIFTISSLFFIYLLYLSIPSLYDTGRVQRVLSNKLITDFDLNISLSTDITYRLLPQPHFLVKDSKLFNLKSKISHEIGEFKELQIYINQNNFFDKNNISIKKIGVSKANFFIKKNDFEFIKNIFGKKLSEKRVNIKKSKIFFSDKNNNVIFIYTIINSNFSYSHEKNENNFKTNGNIFKIPIRFRWIKNFDDESTITKLNTDKISIDLLNKSTFNEGQYYYENNLNILNNKFKTNYEFKGDSIILNSKKSIIKNTPINYNGKINLKPFSFNFNIRAKEFNLSYFMKNNYLLNEIIYSELLLNEHLNGKIYIESDKISKNKIFDKIYLFVNFEEGRIDLNNTILSSSKIGLVELYESNLVKKEEKIFLDGKISLDINDLNTFYKILLISKKNRKNLKKIDFDFSLDIINGDTIINRIIFYDNKNNRINSEIIDELVEDNIGTKFNYSNFILFKNYFKKILVAYSKEG